MRPDPQLIKLNCISCGSGLEKLKVSTCASSAPLWWMNSQKLSHWRVSRTRAWMLLLDFMYVYYVPDSTGGGRGIGKTAALGSSSIKMGFLLCSI